MLFCTVDELQQTARYSELEEEWACDFERIDAKLTKRYDFNSRCLEFLVYLQAEMIKGDRRKRILKISYYC